MFAAAPGRVTQSYFEPLYGNRVVVDHGTDEKGDRILTRYLHLSKRWVKSGAVVQRGQRIGDLGRTGALASGLAHLHFEVVRDQGRLHNLAEDPSLYWVGGIGVIECYDPTRVVPDIPFRIIYPVQCRSMPAIVQPPVSEAMLKPQALALGGKP